MGGAGDRGPRQHHLVRVDAVRGRHASWGRQGAAPGVRDAVGARAGTAAAGGGAHGVEVRHPRRGCPVLIGGARLPRPQLQFGPGSRSRPGHAVVGCSGDRAPGDAHLVGINAVRGRDARRGRQGIGCIGAAGGKHPPQHQACHSGSTDPGQGPQCRARPARAITVREVERVRAAAAAVVALIGRGHCRYLQVRAGQAGPAVNCQRARSPREP